ncbi:MAG: hypothetical protein AAF799_44520 [Myxococcota bacterium]
MTPLRVAGLLVVLATTGCLENLNQQKYFEKLEAADPSLAQRVRTHRESIERRLGEALAAESPDPIVHVGYWGETWDLVRRVTDGERLFMRGRLFHEGVPASTYYLSFTVADDGTVGDLDARVYSMRGLGQ